MPGAPLCGGGGNLAASADALYLAGGGGVWLVGGDGCARVVAHAATCGIQPHPRGFVLGGEDVYVAGAGDKLAHYVCPGAVAVLGDDAFYARRDGAGALTVTSAPLDDCARATVLLHLPRAQLATGAARYRDGRAYLLLRVAGAPALLELGGAGHVRTVPLAPPAPGGLSPALDDAAEVYWTDHGGVAYTAAGGRAALPPGGFLTAVHHCGAIHVLTAGGVTRAGP